MRDFTRAGFVGMLALVAALGTSVSARAADDKTNDSKANANTKSETVRGVVAGVTLEGETAIDFASNRAETVSMSFLTIVGSPTRNWAHDSANADRNKDNKDNKDNDRDRDKDKNAGQNASGDRQRHNIYLVWLTPQTQFRDATMSHSKSEKNANANTNANANANATNANANANANTAAQGMATTLDKLEVGDHVEVTLERREYSRSNGGANNEAKANRHGRHRIYFGNATSVTILSMPNHDMNSMRSEQDRNRNRDRDRDDDKDKTRNTNR